MSSRIQRLAVTGVVATGVGLIATAAGGVARIDGQLAAATQAPPAADTRMVVERPRCKRPAGEEPDVSVDEGQSL
jgi:hypothetical protein